MRNNNIVEQCNGIIVEVKPNGFKDEITQNGVSLRLCYDISVTNKSAFAISWMKVEVSTLLRYKTNKISYGHYIKDGNSDIRSVVLKGMTRSGHKKAYLFSAIEANGVPQILADQWESFGLMKINTLKKYFHKVIVYQIYGEFSDGSKFHKNFHQEIEFDKDEYNKNINLNSYLFSKVVFFLTSLVSFASIFTKIEERMLLYFGHIWANNALFIVMLLSWLFGAIYFFRKLKQVSYATARKIGGFIGLFLIIPPFIIYMYDDKAFTTLQGLVLTFLIFLLSGGSGAILAGKIQEIG